MARNEETREVTGIFLGGMVPLEGVGFVLAELYKRGGHPGSMQVSPFWKEPKPKKLENGVSGLLVNGAAATSATQKLTPLFAKLREAGDQGITPDDCKAILEVECNFRGNSKYYELIRRKVLLKRRGHIYLGPKAPHIEPQLATVSEAPANPDEKVNKRTVARDLILAAKGEPVTCDQIKAAWKENLGGKAGKNWENKPVKQLVDEGIIIRLGRGKYSAAKSH